MKKIIIFCDGGARGNPGPAAAGVVIKDETGKEIAQFGKKIGKATNNVAEYSAVIFALEWVRENITNTENLQIDFYLDSRLVVNQLNGLFKVKNANLRELIIRIRELEARLSTLYNLIPREENYLADRMVNMALDNRIPCFYGK